MRASERGQQPGAPSSGPGSTEPPVGASSAAPDAAAPGPAAPGPVAASPTTPDFPASGSGAGPGSAAEAIAMVLAGLGWLAGTTSGGATAGADVAGMPGEVQA